VIRLATSFGGSKTHDEIALWHICKQGREIHGLERFTDISAIPDRPIQVAAIDGRDLDPEQGVYHADSGFIALLTSPNIPSNSPPFIS
jgi:hypothetical protein